MGLFIISGTMGGGKSYYAAELARQAWKAGRIVHSNIPWTPEVLQREGWTERHIKLPDDHLEWCGYETGPDGKKRLASSVLVGGVEGNENLVIVDEAALLLHSMDQLENKKRNRSLFELVVMSRQIGIDVYFISQSAANLDVAIRNVAELEIRCVNVARIPFWGPLMAGPMKMFFGDFRRNFLSQKGKLIEHTYARYDSRIGEMYNTHGVGDTIAVKRSPGKAKKSSGSLRAWAMAAIPLLPLGYAFWNWKSGPSYLPGSVTLERDSRDTPAPGQATATRAPEKLPRLVAEFPSRGMWVDEFGRVYSISGQHGRLVVTSKVDGDVLTLETPSQTYRLHVPR